MADLTRDVLTRECGPEHMGAAHSRYAVLLVPDQVPNHLVGSMNPGGSCIGRAADATVAVCACLCYLSQ